MVEVWFRKLLMNHFWQGIHEIGGQKFIGLRPLAEVGVVAVKVCEMEEQVGDLVM